MGNNRSVVGDWITLEAGVPLPMEILIGDNGGVASFFLAVEVEGVDYERNRQGGPILPAFKTAELSRDLLDVIYKELIEGEISLTNGPVFCDYDTSSKVVAAPEEPENPEVPEAPVSASSEKEKMRIWTLLDGRTIEAEFVNFFGGKVVLKNARGKTYKILPEKFSAEDIEYSELARPPDFSLNFMKNFKQVSFNGGFYDYEHWARPPEQRGHYGIQLKQTSTGEYNHELKVEIFVVGQQRGTSKPGHMLLDRQKTAFKPFEQQKFLYEFTSPREVVLNNYSVVYYSTVHGEKYLGYLVTITDERGELIAVESSTKWLYENLENLKELSVGNYMDKTCRRTYPSPPKKSKFY